MYYVSFISIVIMNYIAFYFFNYNMYIITQLCKMAAFYPHQQEYVNLFKHLTWVDMCYRMVTTLSHNCFLSYAVIFYDHRIQEDMLPELTKVCWNCDLVEIKQNIVGISH